METKMFERNLQGIGQSLLVSLPKEWTRMLKLKKGSSVKMSLSDDGKLMISPEFVKKSDEKKEIEIVYDKNFTRRFIKEYFAGNEKITINLPKEFSEKESKWIHEYLGKFMNVQILEENKSRISVKCFKIEELSIEECLKRMNYLSLDIFEEMFAKNHQSKIEEISKSITKFYLMLIMQIRRFLGEGKFIEENQISLLRAMDYRMVAEKTERTSELLKNFGEIEKREVLDLLKKIKEEYEKAFDLFVSSNFKDSLEVDYSKLNKSIGEQRIKAEKSKDIKLLGQIEKLEKILKYTNETLKLTR